MPRGDRLTADVLSDLRAAIIRQIDRQQKSFGAGRAVEMGPQFSGAINALGASHAPSFEGGLATGYDGTHTLIAFTWDLSTWGSDVWSGS